MAWLKEKIREHLNNFLRSSVVVKDEKDVLLRHIDYISRRYAENGSDNPLGVGGGVYIYLHYRRLRQPYFALLH